MAVKSSPKSKAAKAATTKRKAKRSLGLAVININASFNNTHITVADRAGEVVAWRTAGAEGFSGSKKSTPFAAAQVMKVMIDKMKQLAVTQAEVIISGIGSGRESALRVLGGSGIDILSITDKTPVPHNGCRPRKSRRV